MFSRARNLEPKQRAFNEVDLVFVLFVFGSFFAGLYSAQISDTAASLWLPLISSVVGLALIRTLGRISNPVQSSFISESRDRKGLNDSIGTEELERLIDGLPDGLAETDSEGKIRFINGSLTRLLGMESFDRELFEKATIQDLLALKSQSAPLDELARSETLPEEFEIERQQENGTQVLRVSRSPIRSLGKQPELQAWSVVDVTQFRQADRVRCSFLDTATHELRTPLANIKAYAETLATNDFEDQEEQKQYCDVISNEVSRLARFIDDLLDLSSIEAGALTAQTQPVNISEMIREIITAIEFQMRQKGIQLNVSMSDNIPILNLDREKISTCLMNLLGNASKYTPIDGQVNLSVEIDERQLVVEVADTGYGISQDAIPHIFDKFYRSDDDRVHQEVGSGLGLAYAKEVIRLHGGTIKVESELDRGSRFIVKLPLPCSEVQST